MGFPELRTELESYAEAQSYTSLIPASAVIYPSLELVQVRAVLEASSGEGGVVEFRHNVPSVTFKPDNPSAITAIDSNVYAELKDVALEFWDLYLTHRPVPS
jgi:hypothetical protein